MSRTRLPLWLLRDSEQAVLLRQPAQAVAWDTIQTPAFQKLIDDMLVTMQQASGIGLAAPQVGYSLRLAVISDEVAPNHRPLVIINPALAIVDHNQIPMEEGCLSIPKVYGLVHRSVTIQLKALDRHGQSFEIQAHGLLARVLQHEFDHLQGRLIADRLIKITAGELPT